MRKENVKYILTHTCTSTDQGVLAVIKKNWTLIFFSKGKNRTELKIIMLSKKSQTWKEKCHLFTLIEEIWKKDGSARETIIGQQKEKKRERNGVMGKDNKSVMVNILCQLEDWEVQKLN